MGRPKTISDEQVLRVARDVFRSRGHTATTREIAQAAGISEAILYQRFGSKDHLFFAAMHPTGPDIERLLGPADPPEDARAYVRMVTVRIGEYFAGVIPLALRVMTHPSFDHTSFGRALPRTHAQLQEGLSARIISLARRRRLATASASATARVLVSLAHDWALAGVHSHIAPARRARELKELVEIVWQGLRVRTE
jgi:AcrR family transcriptional regulator